MWNSIASGAIPVAIVTAAAFLMLTQIAARAACLDTARPVPSAVVLHLADHVGLARDAREEMVRETTDLWRAAGVHVEWSFRTRTAGPSAATVQPDPVRDVVLQDVPHVHIIITRLVVEEVRRSAVAGRLPLASILFVDGKPTTLMRAYPSEVERLLEVARLDDESLVQRPPRMRARLVGRVLGRAVAHELGHFLFASAVHTPFGLMRASHRSDHLLAPSRHAFQVVAAPPPPACTVASVAGTTRVSGADANVR